MSQTFMAKPSFARFNILVVDDDSTSLAIVSAVLKHWDYDVVTVKRPVDALATIRIQQDIDLVITDLHMPEMNGLELQKEINEEFIHLPVMVMSSDDRESVIMKSLASGAVFYMVKPVNPDALRNVWQYAVTYKKGKSIFIEEISCLDGGSSAEKISFDHDIVSGSSMNEEKESKTNSKRKASKRGKDELEEENATGPKKAKVVWTNSLHNRFLQAIRHITLEKAVPKKILEFMNVPGLTRENVASHLQKYRIFLKRVAEKGINAASMNFNHRSSFASGRASMMFQEVQDYAQTIEKQPQMRASPFIPTYGDGISALNGTPSIGSIGFQSHNSMSRMGLLGDQANFHQSFFGNTANPLYQANPGTIFGNESIEMGTNSLSYGGLSGGLMNGTNSNQMYIQKAKSRPDPYGNNIGASSLKGFGTSGLDKMGTINHNPYLSSAGIRLNDDEDQLVGAGQVRLNVKGYAGAGNEGATFHGLPPGDSSSSAGFAVGNEQENTSVLPPLSSSQQLYGLGKNVENDFTFGLMNNANASVNDDTAQPEQLGEGADFGDLLFDPFFDPSDFQFLFQQQGDGEGALNPHIGSGSGSHQPELNHPINQSQNPDLSSAFAVKDIAPSPWNESMLKQIQDIQEVMNQDLGISSANPLNDYYPIFDQNPDNQLQDSENNTISDLNDPHRRENSPAQNQACLSDDFTLNGLDDEFINSLFRDQPY